MKRCGDSCCCTICKPLHRPLSEWDETRLIDQRDAAEAALSETYLIVTGRQPEWSNRFGYRDYDPDAHLRRSLDHFAAKGERP